MVNGLLGKKVEMSQLFGTDGQVVPVTILELGPCVVTQVKTKESDGYGAVQIAYGDRRPKTSTKPLIGHYKKAGTGPKRVAWEVEAGSETPKLGETVNCSVFKEGEYVDVTGTTKGRGFAGTIKAHHFTRGPETHGSMNVRQPGSIGSNTDPGRVWKGKKMCTHLGDVQRTTRNLQVVKVDAARNLVLVKGCVPGSNGSFVKVRKAKYQR